MTCSNWIRAFGLVSLSFALALVAASARAEITIATVLVGEAGNAADPISGSLFGSVDYAYHVGRFEVTAGQYTAFLDAVGAADATGLYDESMADTDFGPGITRDGTSGSFNYMVAPEFFARPMTRVSFGNAMRFANWLHNGQPTGPQDLTTTEDGAYSLNGTNTNGGLQAVDRNAGWRWAVTSEDEWYKAAYYDPGTSQYFRYPTGSNAPPGRDLTDVSGNDANYFTPSGPYPITPPIYTTTVGEFQDSDSPFGTFDQGGNVFEWTEARVGPSRLLRGGAFNSTGFDLLATTRSYVDFPFNRQIALGFRVVATVPEPSIAGMITTGILWACVLRRPLRVPIAEEMVRAQTGLGVRPTGPSQKRSPSFLHPDESEVSA